MAWPCPRTSPRSSPAASLCYDNYAAYGGLCRRSLSHNSWSPLCYRGWTTATESSLDFLPVNSADCSPFSTRQRDWSTASIDTTTWHHCCSIFTGCQCQNAWTLNSASWYFAVCMVSALIISRRISSLCPRFSLARDCIRPPVPMSWFLPHAGLHLVTAHFRSQEIEHGTRYRPVSPPHYLSSFRWLLKTFLFQRQLRQ